MIGIRDFTVVETSLVVTAIRLRRVVRIVWIVKVKPEKERPLGSFLQPCDGMHHTLFCTPVHQADVFLLKGLGGKTIVIEIETAAQTPTAVKHERTHHGPGSITRMFECLRYRTKLRCK